MQSVRKMLSSSSVKASVLLVTLGLGAGACASSKAYSPKAKTSADRSQQYARANALCAGLPEEVRKQNVLEDATSVRRAETLSRTTGRQRTKTPTGAAIEVSAKPGVTPQWLERVARCQAADYAAGIADEGASSNPLAVDDISVQVQPKGDAFIVLVESDDRESAEEVSRRAKSLSTKLANLRQNQLRAKSQSSGDLQSN